MLLLGLLLAVSVIYTSVKILLKRSFKFLFNCRDYILMKGHFTVIEPSKFQNKTMKSSNINALFCHTNTKMPENYNFQILVHCYPIIN